MSFAAENESKIGRLLGLEIGSATAIEMAIFKNGPKNEPVFRDPNAPFVQLHILELSLVDGRIARFANCQNDDTFGIAVDYSDNSIIDKQLSFLNRGAVENPIFRLAPDLDFPKGLIINVEIQTDQKSDVTEIVISVGNKNVLLKAGEAYETNERQYKLHSQDESILFFRSLADRQSVNFDN